MKTICSIESCQDGYLLLTSSRDCNETKHRNGVVINSEILLKVMERNVMEWMWSSSTKRVGGTRLVPGADLGGGCRG